MKINSKQEDIGFDDLMEVADYAEVNNGEDIIEEVAETVSQWPNFAKEAGISDSLTKEIGTHLIADKVISSGPRL